MAQTWCSVVLVVSSHVDRCLWLLPVPQDATV